MSGYALESVARAICETAGNVFGGGIGRGSYKETFVAETPDGGRLAVKVLKPGCSAERSDREIVAMKRCVHPNIASLLDLSEITVDEIRYTYMIEPFMEGGTLEDRLRGGLLIRQEVFELGDSLISAVEHIADLGLVHRDFKPANIMYPLPGAAAVVGDFGIVRDLNKESLTKTYLFSGPCTPFFAAPEQLNNDKAMIDWRTDQFAIGVTLTLSLLGIHPYQEEGDDIGKTLERVEGRKGPSEAFIASANNSNLPVLVRMVSPWPVGRVRTPSILLSDWRCQRGNN